MADTLDGARSQIRDAGLIVLTRAQMTASVAVWDSKQTHRPPRGGLPRVEVTSELWRCGALLEGC